VEISNIRKQVNENQNQEYVVKNGLLCRKLNGDALIVVPKLMQNSIIKQAHERGHFSSDKTEKLIKVNYWFKGMCKKIEKVIQNCINCVLAEKKSGKREVPIPKGEN